MKTSADDSTSYASRTRHDPNPLKRFVHRDRFTTAIKVFELNSGGLDHNVLDFGSGDGELARSLRQIAIGDVVAYEPAPTFQHQLGENLSRSSGVDIVQNLHDLPSHRFDAIFCLEVLEHLTSDSILKSIQDFDRLLAPSGYILVGVPHEIHLPALAKGLFRMVRRFGTFDGSPRNVIRAALGKSVERPMSQLSDKLPYYFDHLGFDYRKLEDLLERKFTIEKRFFRPFELFGPLFNSEVYYLLRKP